ncbi:sn-glycerol-3-phosphate ABC transporter permease UgpE [Legionella sp. W05-934-2]|jgi:sn-glycerol 3-phosphate transport system permease protein|uniref:sn-glycerol-3-phosphate ABC transporter permease UgpE n=1 Tax=Legionella sp. W05-934-2 TaxID=1198649 RepID=UPI0034620C01
MKKRLLLIHILLISFILIFFAPIYVAVIAASHQGDTFLQGNLPLLPGGYFWHNIKTVLWQGVISTGSASVFTMLMNSFLMAMLIAFGKVIMALMTAFVLVYFEFRFKSVVFAMIFMTMMLPVEVRIVPTFQVVVALDWLNSFAGLTLPLMASATATFLFRQFFKSLPSSLVHAAKMDGAGPFRFFIDMVVPLSKTPMTALFIIMFVYGWNQYLWPMIITTMTDKSTIVMGMKALVGVADQIPQWHLIMSTALIALLPPCAVVLILQKWFEKGLTH